MKFIHKILILIFCDFCILLNFILFTHIRYSKILTDIVYVYVLFSIFIYIILSILERLKRINLFLSIFIVFLLKAILLINIYIGQTF